MNETIEKLNALKARRRTMNSLAAVCFIIGLILFLCLTFSNLGRSDSTSGIPLVVLIICIIAAVAFVSFAMSYKEEFRELYKNQFVVNVLSEHFDNVVYQKDEGFDYEDVLSFKTTKCAHSVFTEDYIKGEYEGIPFEQADVKVQTTSKYPTVYFKGRMFILTVEKQDVDSVQVISNDVEYVSKIKGAKAYPVPNKDQFNSVFQVKACDPADIDKVLTPYAIEGLVILAQRHPDIILRYYKDKIYISINNSPNSFDPGENEDLNVEREQARIQRDVQLIKDVIDYLIGPTSIFS